LLVDPDAVLPGAVAAQFLQSVAGRDLQVVEGLGRQTRSVSLSANDRNTCPV